MKSANKEEFGELFRLGILNDDSIVFNNLVETLEDFETNWKVPLGESWHKNLLSWEAVH